MLKHPDFRRGSRHTLPVLVPVVPFALVLGLTIAESPVPDLVGWLGSSLIFGGAAQLTVVTLAGSGAALGAVVAAGLVVNARHFMYSAALSPAFKEQPGWFRRVAPYLLIDQVFALTTFQMDESPESFRHYYLGAGITFWTTWQLTVAVGLVVGPVVPETWSLGFAVPLLFVGLLVGALRSSHIGPASVAAAVAGAVTWASASLPNRAGLLVGTGAGIVAGLLAEEVSS
jgi:predicted branched-subunit amino acid permease